MHGGSVLLTEREARVVGEEVHKERLHVERELFLQNLLRHDRTHGTVIGEDSAAWRRRGADRTSMVMSAKSLWNLAVGRTKVSRRCGAGRNQRARAPLRGERSHPNADLRRRVLPQCTGERNDALPAPFAHVSDVEAEIRFVVAGDGAGLAALASQ
jgi:hypothetical protein